MTLPSLIFGALTATLLGALFHLWKGGGPAKLLLYQILAWVGFFGGHIAAIHWDWAWGKIGPLAVGPGILGALILLAIGHYLSLTPN